MKTKNIILIIAVILVLGATFYYSPKNTGNTIKEDIFNGEVTNIKLSPQILEGTGVYDRSCNPVENGLTQCDAGIQTSQGLLNFNYKHDMHAQACLDQGQKLKVEILEGGKAIVTRY